MRFFLYKDGGAKRLGIFQGTRAFGIQDGPALDLATLLASGASELSAAHERIASGRELDPAKLEFLPPLPNPGKIVCMGLNYREHAAESGMPEPSYPAIFGRFASSLIGHQASIVRPTVSDELDYEGELVAIVGKPGRNIPRERALEHVAGYSIFNDASVRDYQFKSAQWTIGKNFDDTGAFGPAFVSADELPLGAKGLRLTTKINGQILQNASTNDLIFDVAAQVSLLSEVMMLCPGDVIVTGTPSGVGAARNPKIFLKPGDVCVVEIEGVGQLSNPVVQQTAIA